MWHFGEVICGILPKRFAKVGIAGVFSLDIWETTRHRIVCLKIRRGSNEPRLPVILVNYTIKCNS